MSLLGLAEAFRARGIHYHAGTDSVSNIRIDYQRHGLIRKQKQGEDEGFENLLSSPYVYEE